MHEYRNVSQGLTFDFYEIDSVKYPSITKAVAKQFQLEPVGELVIGPDELFQEYQREGLRVGLEWDIWSGYIVVANTEAAEDLTRDIATFIEARFQR